MALLASSTLPPIISGVKSLALTIWNQLPPSPLPVVPPRVWDRIVRGVLMCMSRSPSDSSCTQMTALCCLRVQGVQCWSDLDRQAARSLVVGYKTWPLGLKLSPYIQRSSWMPCETELASCLPIRPAFLRPTEIIIVMPGLLMTSDFARQLLRSPTITPGPQLMWICGRYVLLVVTVRHLSAMPILQRRPYGLF